MNVFTGKGTGRTIIINLDRDELLLESVTAALEKEGVKNAVMLGCIGSLQKAVYNRVDTFAEKLHVEILTVEAPMELCAVQGIVVDGKPHFHMVFSDLDRTYMGHLEPGCKVLLLAEIMLLEVEDMGLTKMVDHLGVGHFVKK
ncbi:MAG: DNA-binding protein [Planctomycetes bacterium]|nr:DNA-binding protein [Planctomycetota bacterium]